MSLASLWDVSSRHTGTFCRPFARFGVFPVGGRSTAVKLRNGDVWVLASTPLDADTKNKLGEIGPVKCAFNFWHSTVILISVALDGSSVRTLCTICSSVRRRVIWHVGNTTVAYTTGEYKKQYPDAKLIAVEEAVKKKAKEGLVFDGGMSPLIVTTRTVESRSH